MAILDDIALRAGVSVRTVSNVLAGRVGVKRSDAVERAERIRQIAEELNYRPNAAARAMSTGRFHAIALLHCIQQHHRHMPEALWAGIHQQAMQRDQKILSGMMPEQAMTDADRLPKLLEEINVDGLLLDYIQDAPRAMRAMIDVYRLPAIWMNYKQRFDCVYPDDRRAGRAMAERLIQLGHRKIAYFSRRRDSHYSVTDRRAGYRVAMRRAGLTERDLAVPAGTPQERLQQAAFEALAVPDRPTAVVCYGSNEAISLMHAALRHGLSVPVDLSLIAVRADRFSHPGIRISAVFADFEQVGRQAVDLLLTKIKEPTRELKPIAVPHFWDTGETAAPPALI